MITSAKIYTKINIKIRNKSVADRNPQVYGCSQSPLPQFWVYLLSIQVFHRCRVPQVDSGDLIHAPWCHMEKFPFLFFVLTAPGVQLWFSLLLFWEVWGLLPAFSRCSVGVVPHVDVFLMYLWGGRWSLHLTPPPSWRSVLSDGPAGPC